MTIKQNKKHIQHKTTAFEIIEKQRKIFTTNSKTRRHVRKFRSHKNLKAFMEHLWFDHGLKEMCSYDTLAFEFTDFFATNDTRTVERYIGCPERVERHKGAATLTRVKASSGETAQFFYATDRRIPKKRGLAQILGYISFVKVRKEWKCFLHHERFPYYTEQTVLSSQEINDESSNGNQRRGVCVSSMEPAGGIDHESGEFEESVEAADIVCIERKKEEVIDSTHTCEQRCNYASEHIDIFDSDDAGEALAHEERQGDV